MAFEATFGAHLLAKEAEVRRARSGRSCRIGASARASDDGRCPPRRLALAAVVTGLIVAVLGLLAPTAGATAAPQPQTRVAAIGRPAGQVVGPHDSVLADQGRPRAPNYDQSATGSSVAAEGGASTSDLLSNLASNAQATVGEGSGPVYGTAVHSEFASEINALGDSNLSTEVSYLNGEVVPYGTAGSVRLYVVEGNVLEPQAAYDLKTGSATLTPARIAQIRANLPPGYQNIPVVEIRP
jgi:hypothetical protein